MKSNLPRVLSAVAIVQLLLAAAVLGQGFTPIDIAAAQNNEKPAETDGQALVAAAARRVLAEAAVAADLRFKVEAFGHELVGSGRYLQLGAGAEKLLRLELKMQVAGKPATLQEICGPRYCWIRRDVPPAAPTLGRVDLQDLRQALARRAIDQPSGVMPLDGWLMLGGLPRLLASLDKNFDFGPAKAEELQYKSSDGTIKRLPTWVIEGEWKPDRLAALLGQSVDQPPPAELPEQIPHRVQLVLGRTEEILPLFPYRITYLRLPKVDEQGRAGELAPRELVKLELFNVYPKSDIDPREFDYQPAGQELEVQDLTTAYLQRFSGETKLR
jgi:hypothetical protein